MWNLSLCYAFPNGPINIKLVYMLFKASADADANMVWWFGRPTGQELYYPKLKSFGSLTIIVVKFPIGVCRPDRIMLTGRLTSTLLYAKGLSSLRPFHLTYPSSPWTKPPRGFIHRDLSSPCILHVVVRVLKPAHSHTSIEHVVRVSVL